jgi:hypothetical protein
MALLPLEAGVEKLTIAVPAVAPGATLTPVGEPGAELLLSLPLPQAVNVKQKAISKYNFIFIIVLRRRIEYLLTE